MAKKDEAAEAAKETKSEAAKEANDLRIAVTAPNGPFRRAGFAFGPEPVTFAIDDLTEAQIEMLKREPELRIGPAAD